jgi:hypothetical protein
MKGERRGDHGVAAIRWDDTCKTLIAPLFYSPYRTSSHIYPALDGNLCIFIYNLDIMFYTEQDPLLPRDKGLPGIRDSHPQGINRNVENTTNHASRKSRKAFNDSMTVVLALCSAIIFTMLFLPTNLFAGLFDHRWRFGHQKPLSIQERVDRILTDTPLIGISGILSFVYFQLIRPRWPQ